MRTYERGVEGETLACGTGALAAARLAVVRGVCSFPVEVRCRSGEKLMVDDAEGCMVLSGRAVKMEEEYGAVEIGFSLGSNQGIGWLIYKQHEIDCCFMMMRR